MKPKVSVIVPILNTEKYLPQCLTSLFSQTYKNIEIICVNDGSTDSCSEILNQYAQKDERIKIISQQNQGQGVARNNAMKIAQGKYFAFVDSDDWLEPNAIETLCDFAEDNSSQVVQFNYTEYDDASGEKREGTFAEKTKREYGYDLRAKPFYNWHDFKKNCFCILDPHTWSYFYNAEFVKKNGVKFASGKRAEDHLFSFGAVLAAEKIDYLDKPLYCYRRRNGSTTKTRAEDNFFVFDNVKQLRNFIVVKGLWNELVEEFHCYEKQIMIWHYEQTPMDKMKEYETLCKARLSADEWKEIRKAFKEKRNFWRKNIVKKIAKRYLPIKTQNILKTLKNMSFIHK